VDTVRDIPRDDVTREWVIWGTVLKIEKVYTNRPVNSQSLATNALNEEVTPVTHFSPRSATAMAFSGEHTA